MTLLALDQTCRNKKVVRPPLSLAGMRMSAFRICHAVSLGSRVESVPEKLGAANGPLPYGRGSEKRRLPLSFEAGEGRPALVGRGGRTTAVPEVSILAALHAESRAIGPANGPHRKRQQNLFAQGVFQP